MVPILFPTDTNDTHCWSRPHAETTSQDSMTIVIPISPQDIDRPNLLSTGKLGPA